MSFFSQKKRVANLTTPLETDSLVVAVMSGSDSLNSLFYYQLELLAEASAVIDFDAILGKEVSVSLDSGGSEPRWLSGIVTEFTQGAQIAANQSSPGLCRYSLCLQPKLWTLGLSVNSRIFQGRTPLQVVESILKQNSVSFSLKVSEQPAKRNYIVQFNESDLQFVSRLLEEEGLTYFFQFEKGSHTLIITDNLGSAAISSSNAAKLTYEPQYPPGTEQAPIVTQWSKSQKLVSGQSALVDFQFEQANQGLKGTGKPKSGSISAGLVSHSLAAGNLASAILTRYPGLPAHHVDCIGPDGNEDTSALSTLTDLANKYCSIDIGRATAEAVTATGVALSVSIQAASKFNLDGHFNGNGDYLVVSTSLKFDQTSNLLPGLATDGIQPFVCQSEFRAIPSNAAWYPPLRSIRPRIDGLLTAVVTTGDDSSSSSGSSSDNSNKDPILTDKFGRIKVVFPWATVANDSDGITTNSCWIRYAQPWAGSVWGFVAIPREGQEVVIAFEQGDPDRPIAIGSVYNSSNMPPFELPTNKTFSGLKSSTPTGTADQFSGFAFNDTKGEEEIRLHSERHMTIQVEQTCLQTVGGTRYMTVAGNSFERFGGKFQASGSGSGGGGDGSSGNSSSTNVTAKPGDYWKDQNTIDSALGKSWTSWEQPHPPGLCYRGSLVYGNQLETVVGVESSLTLGDAWSIVMAPAGLQSAGMSVTNLDDLSEATELPGTSDKSMPGSTSILIGASNHIGIGSNCRFDQGSSVSVLGNIKSSTDSVNSALNQVCSKAAANVVSAASTNDSFSNSAKGSVAGSLVGLTAESLLGGLVGQVVTSAIHGTSAVAQFAGMESAASPLTGQDRCVTMTSATNALSNAGSALADMITQIGQGVSTKISHLVQLCEGTALIGAGQSILMRASADTNVFPNCGKVAGSIAIVAEGVPGGSSPSGSLVMMGGELFSLGTGKDGDKYAHICANSSGEMIIDSGSAGSVQINAANSDQNILINPDLISVTTQNKPVEITTNGGTMTIKTANGVVTIDSGSGAISIKSNSGGVTIDSGSGSLSLTGQSISLKATQGVEIQGATFSATGQQSATMKNSSGNSLELGSAGATLKGLNTTVQASVQHEEKGVMIQASASSMAKRTAALTMD